jgi:hypothetical protein
MRTRRSWRKLHIGVDADTGQIIATELTTNDIDDAPPTPRTSVAANVSVRAHCEHCGHAEPLNLEALILAGHDTPRASAKLSILCLSSFDSSGIVAIAPLVIGFEERQALPP